MGTVEAPALVSAALAERKLTSHDGWIRLYQQLTDSTLVKVDAGVLGLDAAIRSLSVVDRDQRGGTAREIARAIEPSLNVRAFILEMILLDETLDERAGIRRPRVAAQSFIRRVDEKRAIPHRFYALKARLLGLDRLDHFDRFVRIGPDVSVSWEAARSTVLDALARVDPVASEVAAQLFDLRHIHAAPGTRKPAGYCAAAPGYAPFVAVDFRGDYRSLLALAHEIGHAIYFTGTSKTRLKTLDELTASETAAAFAELLVAEELVRHAAREERLSLVMTQLEDAIVAIFHRAGRMQFEECLREERAYRGALTVDRVNGLWLSAMRNVYGPALELGETFSGWWACSRSAVVSGDYSYAYSRSYVRALAAADGHDRGAFAIGPVRSPTSDSWSSIDSDGAALEIALRHVDDALCEAETLARK